MKRCRGYTLIVYLVLTAAIAGALVGLYVLIDESWETAAGVRAGELRRQADWNRAELEQRSRDEQKIAPAAAGLEVDRAKAKTVERVVTQYVDRVLEHPVYRNVCLDDDGLRIARCALRGESPDRCQLDEPLRGPHGSAGRERRDGASLDHVDGEPVPRLPGKAAAALRSVEVTALAAP